VPFSLPVQHELSLFHVVVIPLSLGHDTRCHVFHQECIVEWLCRQNGCPVCRQDFLSLEDLDEAETELTESVARLPTEETDESLADEMQSPTEGTEDRPVDDVHRCLVNTITTLS
jgi:hypothetical protein